MQHVSDGDGRKLLPDFLQFLAGHYHYFRLFFGGLIQDPLYESSSPLLGHHKVDEEDIESAVQANALGSLRGIECFGMVASAPEVAGQYFADGLFVVEDANASEFYGRP